MIRPGPQAIRRPTECPQRNCRPGQLDNEMLEWSTGLGRLCRPGPPQGPSRVLEGDRAGLKTQSARFHGRFSYCEGSGCGYCEGVGRECDRSAHGEHVWHIFYKFGRGLLPGRDRRWTPPTNRSLRSPACGRGQGGRQTLGHFFAPWGPKGVTCFIPERTSRGSAASPRPDGKKGPSSALQRRIFFHAYLSGAHTLHEEWGGEGNLLDWDQGKISSYGKVTRDLLDFQEAHPTWASHTRPSPWFWTPRSRLPTPRCLNSGESPHVGPAEETDLRHADADKAAAARRLGRQDGG